MSRGRLLVLATRNRGKAAEFSRALGDTGMALTTLASFAPFPAPRETGKSFRENAAIKARVTAAHTGRPALADDSGLCVAALEGAPGILSSRFAGPAADDEANMDLLLEKLAGHRDRSAWFSCALCLAEPGGELLWQGEGRCHGVILPARAGSGGFGYDPLFLYPPERKSFGQMTGEEKFRVSHRGEAVRAFRRALADGIAGLE